VNDFLAKPLDINQLLAALRHRRDSPSSAHDTAAGCTAFAAMPATSARAK
jgi:hypothetical protein